MTCMLDISSLREYKTRRYSCLGLGECLGLDILESEWKRTVDLHETRGGHCVLRPILAASLRSLMSRYLLKFTRNRPFILNQAIYTEPCYSDPSLDQTRVTPSLWSWWSLGGRYFLQFGQKHTWRSVSLSVSSVGWPDSR